MKTIMTAVATLTLCVSATEAGAQVVLSSSGSTAASIQPQVDAFRTSLGTLNPNVAGSAGSGRREINWDGVPDAAAAPNSLAANFFNVNSPRGVVLSTPGSGFQVSASAASGTPIEFGNINPTYSQLFATFSAQRLFTATGSNIVDVNFFIPGTSTPGLVTGFGAVFTDVDLANSTSISFFDLNNLLLGTWNAPSFAGNETFSFLGVRFDTAVVSRVRITSGNAALGVGTNESAGIDLVAMDDFIFGEPVAATAVPEPGTWAMMFVGFGVLGWQLRRRRAIVPAASSS